MSDKPTTAVETLIAQATTAAGPAPTPNTDQYEGWLRNIDTIAVDLYFKYDEQSTVRSRITELQGAETFRGVLRAARLEPSSKRVVLLLETGTSKVVDPNSKAAKLFGGIPDGHEIIRTDRTDVPLGMEVGERAKALTGHTVLVYRVNEKMANNASGHSTRVVKHLVDLGKDAGVPATDPNPPTRPQQTAPAAQSEPVAEAQSPVEGVPDAAFGADPAAIHPPTTVKEARLIVWAAIDKTFDKGYRDILFRRVMSHQTVDEGGQVTNVDALCGLAAQSPLPGTPQAERILADHAATVGAAKVA